MWREPVWRAVLQWVHEVISLCNTTLPFPFIQWNKFWTHSGSASLQTLMLMPLFTSLRIRALFQMGTWKRSPGLQVDFSRISFYIVAWRESPPKRLSCKSVILWFVVKATQGWTNLGEKWRVHWKVGVGCVWVSTDDIRYVTQKT